MSEQVAEQVAQPDAAPMETPAEVAQGGSGNDFLTMIPEDIREHPSFGPIKDVENLARSYVNAQRLIGSEKIPLPINPTDEDLDNIYGRLGRPEAPDGYEIQADGNVITEDMASQYADIAHKLRLTPQQAQGVLEYYRSSVSNSAEQMQQMVADQASNTEAELRREWGNNYDAKLNAASGAAREFAGDGILDMQLSDGTLVGNHPAFIKAFAAMADFKSTVTSEDSIDGASANYGMTPKQAQAEIDAIMNDKSHAYWDSKNVTARQNAINHMQELMSMIHDR